jgi:hypothetical protein
MTTTNTRLPLDLPAGLVLTGQLVYIAVTQLHAGGPANHHHEIFETYAANGIWTAVHAAQFAGMAILLGGLIALCLTLETGAARTLGRLAAVAAAAAFALYGVLQAVDGVALKQSVMAWASAPEAEKAARFASAETVRWLEWGMRSYQDYALGLALLLAAAALTRAATLPRILTLLMALSGLAYFAQGWIAGTEGFSSAQSLAIVAAWALSLIWMTWLAAMAFRAGSSKQGDKRPSRAQAASVQP